MTIEEIYQFFAAQPPIYLSSEQAACYVLSVLLIEESYGTRLIQKLESDYPPYRLSDTVLYAALNFLETERALVARTQKLVGRGRPRRMYQVSQEWLGRCTQASGTVDQWRYQTVPSVQGCCRLTTEQLAKCDRISNIPTI